MGDDKLDLLHGTLDLLVLPHARGDGAHARLRHRAPESSSERRPRCS